MSIPAIDALRASGQLAPISLATLARLCLVPLDLISVFLIGAVFSGSDVSSLPLPKEASVLLEDLSSVELISGALALYFLRLILNFAFGVFVARRIAIAEANTASEVISKYFESGSVNGGGKSSGDFHWSISHAPAIITSGIVGTLSSLLVEIASVLALVVFGLITAPLLVSLVLVMAIAFGVGSYAVLSKYSVKIGESISANLSKLVVELENLRSVWTQAWVKRVDPPLLVDLKKVRATQAKNSAAETIYFQAPRLLGEVGMIAGAVTLVVGFQLGWSNEAEMAAVLAIFGRISLSLIPIQSSIARLKFFGSQLGRAQSEVATIFSKPAAPIHSSGLKPYWADSPPEIEISGVGLQSTSEPKKWILKDICLSLEPGSILIVRGKSGSGKTSFAEVIAGLVVPSCGLVKVGGETPSAPEIRRQAGIGYCPSKPGLIEGSLRQNIALSRELTIDHHKELDRLIKKLGLSDLDSELWDGAKVPDAKTRAYSAGELQRIGIARALFGGPKLIVLDEPTSHLDTRTEKMVLSFVESELSGKTAVIISHRPLTISKPASEVEIRNGRIV